MLDGMTDGDPGRVMPASADALDTFLAELIALSPEKSIPTVAALQEAGPDVCRSANITATPAGSPPCTIIATDPQTLNEPVTTAAPDASEPDTTTQGFDQDIEQNPDRPYSIADLLLFERLTGYRLVARRQLWRSVDRDGNRSMAGDRLFTVLAEEAFRLADRQRRSGRQPHADLTVSDISVALGAMRTIASHLGERGMEATHRLEAVLTAALDKRAAA